MHIFQLNFEIDLWNVESNKQNIRHGRLQVHRHRIGIITEAQNRDYNRSPTSVGTFDVSGAAHVASRILAAILLASKNGGFDRVLLGSSLQKLDYQRRYRFQS